MNTGFKIAALATSLVVLSACGGGSAVKGDGTVDPASLNGGSGGSGATNADGSNAGGANGNGEFGYGSGGITDGAENAQNGFESQFSGLNDPASPLYTRVIYFDYNATGISAEYQNALLAHAQLLADNPDVRFRLEGHTDERGSREYNIGLGNRRAIAVGQFMQQRGVNPQQIETVSYGEEKPARLEHNAAAWKLNRRVELVYVGY